MVLGVVDSSLPVCEINNAYGDGIETRFLSDSLSLVPFDGLQSSVGFAGH